MTNKFRLAFRSLLQYPCGVMTTNFQAVIERDFATGLFVGYVPGFPGAHSQGESIDELSNNLREVISICWRMASQLSTPNLLEHTLWHSHEGTGMAIGGAL